MVLSPRPVQVMPWYRLVQRSRELRAGEIGHVIGINARLFAAEALLLVLARWLAGYV